MCLVKKNKKVNDMPAEVIEAVKAIVRTGKEAIVKREHGRWLVLENGRRLVYKENEKRT